MTQTMQTGLTYVSPAVFCEDYNPAQKLWLRPTGIDSFDLLANALPQDAFLPLAGGCRGFTHLDLITVHDSKGYIAVRVTIAEAQQIAPDEVARRLESVCAPRPDFAGRAMDRPHIMGIVNVTPDSFSDGGRFLDAKAAITHGREMAVAGAGFLDIGGESTRPRAEPVTTEDELSRIIPVISALAADGHVVCADTRHTAVMEQALAAGASIINDVCGFTAEGATDAMGAAFEADPGHAFAIAMHMQGTPQTMQDNPRYGFCPVEVYDLLLSHVDRLVAAGLPLSHIAVDPGFGFGKTSIHNAQIISWLSLFHGLGVPLLVGISRKSSIPKLAVLASEQVKNPASDYGAATEHRLGGTLALTLEVTRQGVQLIRTHDVQQTLQAVMVQRAIG